MTVVYPRKKPKKFDGSCSKRIHIGAFLGKFIGFSNMKMEWVERC